MKNKKVICLVLAVLLIVLTACVATEPENDVVQTIPTDVTPNADGEITLCGQRFSVDSENLALNLQIRSNEVLDLSPLAWCTQLRKLSINLTVVPHVYVDKFGDPHIADQTPTDLTPLSSLAGLEWLELRVGIVDDFTPLTRLPDLKTLVLWIEGDVDLAPLSACVSLTSLMLGGRGTVDLTPVSRCPALTNLRVDVYDADWNTPDLSALSGAPCLQVLSTGAVRGLKKLVNVPLTKLVDLNDSGDILENLPDLPTLEYVEFSDEHLCDIAPLLRSSSVCSIVLEVGAQDVANMTTITSPDDPLLAYLVTSIPTAQLREFLAKAGASLAIVVDKNRTPGLAE